MYFMKKLWILIAIISVNIASCDTSKKTGSTKLSEPVTEKPVDAEDKPDMLVSFINSDDMTGAMKKAKAANKVLFVDFYTTWCAPCRVMEQSVFRDQLVAEYMNTNCISLRVNAEKGNGPTLKMENAVDAYPTMLVFNSNGDEVARKQGSLGIEDFKKFIKSAVWKANNPQN
jgi:thiol:disulfide interchange protein